MAPATSAGTGTWSKRSCAPEVTTPSRPDLPCEDDAAGLPEYADTVVDAIGDRQDLVVVGQSLGGFTAPLVCDQVAADLLVLSRR